MKKYAREDGRWDCLKEILILWAVFTVVNLSVQEVFKLFILSFSGRSAQLALLAEEHTLLLQGLAASFGAAAACLPFLGRIRWETGFPSAPAKNWFGLGETRCLCYVLLIITGAIASRIAVSLLLEGQGGAGRLFFSAGLSDSSQAGADMPWEWQDAGLRSVWDLGNLSVLYGILTPVIEELFFRGLLMGRLRRTAGLAPGAANLAAALLFALYHGALDAALYAFPLGLILGRTVQKARSVWLPIILHGIANLLMLQLSYRGSLAPFCNLPWLAFFTAAACFFLFMTEYDNNQHPGK